MLIADAAGVSVRGVKAENKRIRILHARDCTLDGINLKNGEFVVEGQADASTMKDAPNLDCLFGTSISTTASWISTTAEV